METHDTSSLLRACTYLCVFVQCPERTVHVPCHFSCAAGCRHGSVLALCSPERNVQVPCLWWPPTLCVLLHQAAGACAQGLLAVAPLPLVTQRSEGSSVVAAGVGWALVTGADFRRGFSAREQRYLEPTLSPSLLMVPHAGREAGEEGRELFF